MRCDCHVHIVGPIARYPQSPDRTYQAGVAPVAALKVKAAASGVTRFVVVQPSFYGADNAVTLGALDELAGQGRGVAVIDPGRASEAILADWHRRGVRGLRVNLYSPIPPPGGGTAAETVAANAAVARRMGWHLQLIAPLPILVAHATLIADLDVPVVLDHYGLYGAQQPDSVDGRALLSLLRHPHVFMKLSAPYRMAHGPLNIEPDRAWLAALIEAAPDRCVWGSDWPHSPDHTDHRGASIEAPYRPLDYTALVDAFIAALPSPDLAEAIMIANPARLYGF